MLRLLKHFGGILCGICVFLMMANLPLYKVPYIQLILPVLIVLAFLFLVGVLGYRLRFKKGKIFIILLLFGCLGAPHAYAITQDEAMTMGMDRARLYGYGVSKTNSASLTSEQKQISMGADRAGQYGVPKTDTMSATGNFCMAAEEYSQKTFNAQRNGGKGDEACPEATRNFIRQKLASFSVVARAPKFWDEWQTTWTSFRAKSTWNEWVQTNFSAVSPMEREEVACAAVLGSMCSSYDERHPSSRAKTVGQIMQEDAETVGCWPCEMSFIVLTVVQVLSSRLSENMQNAGQDILQIFMLLWILYTVFQAVVFPSKGRVFVKEFLARFCSLVIAFLFLYNSHYLHSLYENLLVPLISLGLGISTEINNSILNSHLLNSDFYSEITNNLHLVQNNLCTLSQALSSQSGENSWQYFLRAIFPDLSTLYPNLELNEQNTLITPALEADLLCLVQRMYRQFSPFVATGQSLIGFSFSEGIIPLGFGFFIENLKMWLVGFILTVFFTIFSFLVAFRIIDIFLKLSFTLVLMPLFVVTAVFPVTREFTKKGFAFLIGIVSEFLGLTLAVNFIILLFEVGIDSQRSQLVSAINAPYSKEYGSNLLLAVTSNNYFFFFLFLIGLFFFGISLIKSCVNQVNAIFGAASVEGSLTGAVAVRGMQRVGQATKKTWDVSNKYAENAKPYEVPKDNKPNSLAGADDKKPLESSSAASKRYFGERTGNVLNRTSQHVASGIDKVGVTAGQALQKTGIGALIGVPLTIATKTLSTGIRATGKIASIAIKAPGATVSAVKNRFKKKEK